MSDSFEYTPRFKDMRIKKTKGKRKQAQVEAERVCEWPACNEHAGSRCPKSNSQLNDFYWFCPKHAAQYNKSWNFFEGLSDDDVEAAIKSDTVWQRPTWELGSKSDKDKARAFAQGAKIQDGFGLFNDGPNSAQTQTKHRGFPPDSPVAKAYAMMDLAPPITTADLKSCYKKLVKRHHPDANGGCKEAEEKFKEVGLAYQMILKHLGA
ncbi:MAG: J domain-containing protein [Magnetovibrio sp.]|nr:J domain-containing protein [Magnetovibrio sp.]